MGFAHCCEADGRAAGVCCALFVSTLKMLTSSLLFQEVISDDEIGGLYLQVQVIIPNLINAFENVSSNKIVMTLRDLSCLSKTWL